MSDHPVRIFVSYSHADADYLGKDSLLGFLQGLEREGAEFWTDERIAAGQKWDEEIRSRIAQTDIALVLVSQTFLDSEYCTSIEIAGFLDRSRESGLTIVPVILSPCEWERHSWLRSTQYLPGGGETIEENYVDPGARKRLFLKLRSALRDQIEKLRELRKAAPEPVVAAAKRGERRQVTALECELTAAGGATLDPEEIVQILPAYRTGATEIITRFEGHVAQRQGRRLLAYFGYPRVHEDDGRRAVLAARELAALVKTLAGGQSALALRVAIHTGPMILSSSADGDEPMFLGDVPEIVSALVNATPPDRIHVSAATCDIIDREYVCAPAGSVELKDLGRSMDLYSVEGEEPQAAVETSAPKRLVARDHELEILRQRWELAREGEGQVVCVRGEAGIGKSALLQEIRNEIGTTAIRLECRCSPHHQNSELYPIIDLLHRALSFVHPERQQDSEAQRLEAIVRDLEMPVETVVPLLSALLSIPLPPGYQPVTLSPEGRKKKTLETVLEMIHRLSASQPVVMIVEDLHWVDASTLGFLDLLIETQATAPILTLLTFRPEFDPPWRHLSHFSEVSLRRLGAKEAGALIALLTDGKALPPGVLEEIVEKADGIPLFAEELTRMVTESAGVTAGKDRYLLADGEKLAVPATLEGSLIARLDRLDSAKEVAQVAAVIGREFFRGLLSQAASLEETELAKDLERLLQSEIILRRGLPSNASFFFKHALIQQAAYESILSRDARQLHGRIAQALESAFPDLAERQPEVTAFHFTRAGLTEKAIDYWQRAAERSIRNSAHVEAVAHLTTALDLLVTLPESRERDRREMRLRTALAMPLIATKGYAANEVDEALSRARALCMEVGEDAELFRVLRLLWAFQTVRGDHARAFEAAQQILAMAESKGAPDLRLEADRVLGSSYFYLGRLLEARQHFERAIDFYDRKRDHGHVLIYGQDPGVSCLANESLTLWLLGYPEQALARAAEAVALARELAHPYSLCYSLFFSTWVNVFLRDLDRVQQCVDEIIQVSQHQYFQFWETMTMIIRGWLRAQRGETAAGVAEMVEWLAKSRKLGARLYVPSFLSLIAEVHAASGDAEAGLAAVTEGLSIADATGEGLCVPELYRLQGELLAIQDPGSPAVEASLLRAQETAAAQAAKSFELRAAMSLSRFRGLVKQ